MIYSGAIPNKTFLIPPQASARGEGDHPLPKAKGGGGGIQEPSPPLRGPPPSTGGESLAIFASGAVLHKKTPIFLSVFLDLETKASCFLMGVEFGAF